MSKNDKKESKKQSKLLVNLLENKFAIEGVIIPAKGSVELTKKLTESQVVKHACKIGVLKIDG